MAVAVSGSRFDRILIVHSRYRERGGEDAAVDMEVRLLRDYGHDVILYQPDNRELNASSAATALGAIWNQRARRELAEIAGSQCPAVAHFHNTLPQVSPAAYSAVRRAGVPVVQTLHNYRMVCANSLLVRDGEPCELCVTRGSAWPAIRYACYRGSRPATAAVALSVALHRRIGTWAREVDAYIALSRYAARMAATGGAPAERVHVAPSFLHPDPGVGVGGEPFVLYAGRLAPEKGIDVLLEAWRLSGPARSALPAPWRLIIAGGGPLEETVRQAIGRDPTIEYVGMLERQAVMDLMARAGLFVLPTKAPENLPTAVLEAYARGLPVLASGTASLLEIIDDSTGWTMVPDSAGSLADTMVSALSDEAERRSRGAGARVRFEAQYSAGAGYERLLRVFDGAHAVFHGGAVERMPAS